MPAGISDEPEAIAPDHCAVLHDDARAQDRAAANGHTGMQHCSSAHTSARADDHVRMHDDAIADLCAGLDHRQRPDRDVLAQPHVRRHDRARMHTSGPSLVGAEHDERFRKRAVRLPRPQHGARRRGLVVVQDDGGGVRGVHERPVLGIGEERELTGAGIGQTCHSGDIDVAIAFEAAMQAVGQVAEFH